jgi:sigma-B regulation protein RsbU (phosphoserine phosphatase)
MRTFFHLLKNFLPRFYIPITIIIGFLSVLSLYAILTVSRSSNDECLWRNTEYNKQPALRFSNVKIDGAAYSAGIHEGDLLLRVDGRRIEDSFTTQEYLNTLPEGAFVQYTVSRNDSLFTASVRIKKLVSSVDLAFGLLAFTWLIIGLIVYVAKRDGEIQQLFFKIGLSFALVRTGPLFYPYLPNVVHNPSFVIYMVILIAVYSLHVYWFHRFFRLFPSSSGFYEKQWNCIIFKGIIGFFFLLTLGLFLLKLNQGVIFHTLNYGEIVTPLAIIASIVYLDGFAALIRSLKRMQKSAQINSIILIAFAYGLAILSVLFVIFVPTTLGFVVYNSPEYFAPVVLIVLVPLAFAYSIFRYQLMEVSYVLQSTIIYAVATVIVVAGYLLLVYLLGLMAGKIVPEAYSSISTIFFFILFALLFQSWKDRGLEALSRHFYPEQFALRQTLVGFHKQMANIFGGKSLYSEIEKLFVQRVGVSKFILVLQNQGSEFSSARWQNEQDAKLVLSADSGRLQKEILTKQNLGVPPVFEQEAFQFIFPDHAEELAARGICTAVPLQLSEKIIGFLFLGLKRSGTRFGGKEIELLYSVGQQAAVAFENARLYESEAEKQKLEYDLNLARSIQQSLLPKKFPDIENVELAGEMLPAARVGGDYFDVIAVSPDRFFVIVGDVSGKGLPASLYMTKIQTLMQVACAAGSSPKEILSDVNAQLFQFLDKRSFITISIAMFDLAAKQVSICRAGHPPVILCTDGNVQELKPKGLGLGLQAGDRFIANLEQTEIPLHQGQIFLFYSDGVNEAMNADEECYSADRIAQRLLACRAQESREIISSLLGDIQLFAGNTPQHDDMTLVCLKML